MMHRHTREAKIGAVFSDPTGRRRKRVRRIGYFASSGCVVYMGLLGVSLSGGPISPEQLLPPGVPDKIERLLDPDSGAERRGDGPSQPLTAQDYDSRSRIPGYTPGAATLSGRPENTSSAPGTPRTGQVPLPASPPGAETPAPAPPRPAPPQPAPVEPSPPPPSDAPAEPSEVPVPDLSPEVSSAPDVLSPPPGASE